MNIQDTSATPMPRTLTQLTLFASSTSESAAEIAALRKVVVALNKQLENTCAVTLRLVAWPDDIRPGVNMDPQAEINRQVADYDIYLGILGTTLGTPTARSESGTQEEFDAALSRFRSDTTSVRLLFYFRKTVAGIDLYGIDLGQLQRVRNFRDNLEKQGVLYRDFGSTSEFVELVKEHLFHLIVDEWHGDKWNPVVPSTDQSPTGAELNHGGGQVPKARSREGESASSTSSPDDLDDSDEDELGLLDHVENLHTVTESMVKTFESISQKITRVGEKFRARTEEIDDLKQSEAKTRQTPGQVRKDNVGLYRRIIDGSADDMTGFVDGLAQDVAAYREGNRVMIAEVRGVLSAKREMSSDADDDGDVASLKDLVGTMKTVKGQVGDFQKVMQGVPGLTKKFRKARRRSVSMLGELIAEMSFSIDELEEIVGGMSSSAAPEQGP